MQTATGWLGAAHRHDADEGGGQRQKGQEAGCRGWGWGGKGVHGQRWG